ncbi:MAG: hypothetical protein KGJ58_04095 [Patescibacteria group bacterium]|nr:hypothetical protein [Patescibacteria group bacterium]MDE2218603.1 hypothetical protein [Patescibacteria group bacterium]
MTNRLISEKIASWDFVPPFDFTASFLASRARRRGEQTSLSVSKNLQNSVWWTIIENARTFFDCPSEVSERRRERNAAGVSQNPKPLGRGGKERGQRGKESPPRSRFPRFARRRLKKWLK